MLNNRSMARLAHRVASVMSVRRASAGADGQVARGGQLLLAGALRGHYSQRSPPPTVGDRYVNAQGGHDQHPRIGQRVARPALELPDEMRYEIARKDSHNGQLPPAMLRGVKDRSPQAAPAGRTTTNVGTGLQTPVVSIDQAEVLARQPKAPGKTSGAATGRRGLRWHRQAPPRQSYLARPPGNMAYPPFRRRCPDPTALSRSLSLGVLPLK